MSAGPRFEAVAGRGGTIEVVDGERRGRIGWELLTGDAAIVLYAAGARWTAPAPGPMRRSDLLRLAEALARSRGCSLDVAFDDGWVRVTAPSAS